MSIDNIQGITTRTAKFLIDNNAKINPSPDMSAFEEDSDRCNVIRPLREDTSLAPQSSESENALSPENENPTEHTFSSRKMLRDQRRGGGEGIDLFEDDCDANIVCDTKVSETTSKQAAKSAAAKDATIAGGATAGAIATLTISALLIKNKLCIPLLDFIFND